MIKVAVFDDNPLVLKNIISSVNWHDIGCTIAGTAENGSDAYALLQEIKMDIVISNIKMPGIDGLSLAEKISEMGLHTKIILVTEFYEFALARRAVNLGVFDLLTKPLSDDIICTSVKKAVKALREEFESFSETSLLHDHSSASSLVRHTIAFLCRYYASDITLKTVAGHFQVSTNHLSRTIKKDTGYGFVEILTKIRMSEALKLLKRPNIKVYIAAEQVGYRNYAYFYQVFKKYYNISPQKYRNKFL